MIVNSRKAEGFSNWQVVAIAIAGVAACFALNRYMFPYLVFETDTAAYLFQAKLFAQGVFAAPAPADFGFSPSPHINIDNGLWYAKYPFGTSLFQAPGVALGMPWLMPAVATGLTLWLFFILIRELFDARVASVALVLAVLSPTTLLMGATMLSQPVSKLCVVLFLVVLLWIPKAPTASGRVLLGAVAGLALGYAFNTRPLVAVVFGLAGMGFFWWRTRAGADRPTLVGPLLAMAGTGAVMLALFFGWNALLTGDPFVLTYNALQESDRMGFGVRGEGYAPFVRDFRVDFTPAIAFGRLLWHTIPCVLLNVAGWGWYEPAMLFPSDPYFYFPTLAPVLLVPLALILLPLIHRSRSASDVLCAAIFLLTMGALLFQYSDHTTWGATPLNASYYNEAILVGLIPLAARGVLITVAALQDWLGRLAAPVIVVVGALLVANSVATNDAFVRPFRAWDAIYQVLPRLVAEADLKNAVVFLEKSRSAPVGEYPFVPLDQANVVYFKLGPLPQWGLTIDTWQEAYSRYFAGRAAYLFDGQKLVALDTASVPTPR